MDSKRINERYELEKLIYSGKNCEIHVALDVTTREKVAVKLEKKNATPRVIREGRILKLLGLSTRSLGIPKVKWYGKENDLNAFVMELLGPSLRDLLRHCGGKFSLKTTLMIADQMLKRIEFVHAKTFIHRDIRLSNFLMGITKRSHIVHLIDFDHSKRFRSSQGTHIEYRDDKPLSRTNVHYASINIQLGIEHSRRDDLESLGYMLLHFLRGNLPWHKVRQRRRGEGTNRERDNRVRKVKINTSLKKLCDGHPKEFITYFNYVRSLGFESDPDYSFLRKLFKDLFDSKGYVKDYLYDWVNIEIAKSKDNDEEERVKYLIQKDLILPVDGEGDCFETNVLKIRIDDFLDLYCYKFLDPRFFF